MTLKSTYARAVAYAERRERFWIPAMVLGNWLLQGILNKERSERAFSVILDLGAWTILSVSLSTMTSLEPSVTLGFAMAHTLNWLLNGHFWALMLEVRFSRILTGTERLDQYSQQLRSRISTRRYYQRIVLSGSLARGTAGAASDLDISVVLSPGYRNAIFGCTFAAVERMRALFEHFPLDLHVLDSESPYANDLLS